MAPKQRQIRIEQRGGLPEKRDLEPRPDADLERDTLNPAAARAILGARAADRYDAEASRQYFRQAIAAARPQERMQLRRMADASLALAERRAGDLKDAVKKPGQEAPGRRQLLALQFRGLVAPPAGAGILLQIRGILILIVVVLGLLPLGLDLVELISLPFGGVSLGGGILLGFLVVAAALAVMALLGRRRQQKARAERAAAGS